eukprot:2886219-Amphidinium_carterae.4
MDRSLALRLSSTESAKSLLSGSRRRSLVDSHGAVPGIESISAQGLFGYSAGAILRGFQLVDDDIESLGIDFLDNASVTQSYYPECERLLKATTGAIQAFDHNVRSSRGFEEGKRLKGVAHGSTSLPMEAVVVLLMPFGNPASSGSN